MKWSSRQQYHIKHDCAVSGAVNGKAGRSESASTHARDIKSAVWMRISQEFEAHSQGIHEKAVADKGRASHRHGRHQDLSI